MDALSRATNGTEIDVPAAWNGDLVLYAHGIVQASQPIVTPSNQYGYAAIRAALLAKGMPWPLRATPGLLPGGPFDIPDYIPYESSPPSPLFLQVHNPLIGLPTPDPAKIQRTQDWAIAAKLPFNSLQELFQSALYVVGFGGRYTNDLIERVNGKLPFDNRDVTYPALIPTLGLQLNAGVARYDADRAALNYYERNYQPDGRITFPVVTLHTLRDPAIPYDNENVGAELVAAAGRSNWLVRRSVDRWGHCTMIPAEVLAAFTELETWVRTGVRP